LEEGEKAHPANYRGCRLAKEQLKERKSQRTPMSTTGNVFSNLTTSGVSEAAHSCNNDLRHFKFQWQVHP
jgi:hypothetical protein